MAPSGTITVGLSQIAKAIDHSLLHPTLTDAEITSGLATAKKYKVGAACVKPYSVSAAKAALANTSVAVCAVIGFPHGNSTTAIKVAETAEAARSGATEIDMVVNVGKVLSAEWEYVLSEISLINDAAKSGGAVLKVIFENDYLRDEHIVKLCEICTSVGVAFVKTSTGYGFVKQDNGMYSYKGATVPHLKLMRKHSGPGVQIKAAGGVRTLDEFLHVLSLGVTRVGATATAAILDEAVSRGIAEEPTQVEFGRKDGDSEGAY